jgi:predicted HicB family RNase H-like nuclease
MSYQIFSTFSVVLLVLRCSECQSFSADTRPALKHEFHSKTAVWLEECSPKATRSISRVSVANLLSFMQNLMQKPLLDFAIHCRQNKT